MDKIIHLLLPRMSNNHRAKLIHSSSLLVVSLFLIFVQFGIDSLQKRGGVLGFASSISKNEIVRLTNQKRAEAGLPALTLNENLSGAAYTKGVDMINKDYWAHTAPDGTEPWAFFNSVGYKYRYAGENLARDFSSASSAVEAWMASPTHRDNILNPKYKEIGIGITEGDLAGSDTTIIVQFFGATYADKVVAPVAAAKTEVTVTTAPKVEKPKVIQEQTPVPTVVPSASPVVLPITNTQTVITTPDPSQKVLVSPFVTTKNTSIIVVSILLLVFVVDWFIVSRRRIARITGKTFAHVAFLGMIFAILLIVRAGKII